MAVRNEPRRSTPLVGRVEECRVIATACDEATAGLPSVVWIEGDAGLGKTALLRDALRRLPAGMHVRTVQADELAAEVPFDLAGRLGSTNVESSFAAGIEVLDAWSRLQDDGPVAVVVEDLHWADRASSRALLCAAQRLDEDQVVLVVTSRPDVADGWERLRSDPDACHLVRLGPLTPAEVAELAAASGVDLTPAQAERLHRHTAGHPLYVRTLLRELGPSVLRTTDGDLPAPSTLTSAVAAGLADVPAPARALAAAMAVLNQRTGLAQVAHVAGVAAPVGPIEDLLGTGFVHWDPGEPGAPVEFAHPLYRQAVYQDLSPSTRRDLHRAAAAVSPPEAALAHRVAAADGFDDELARELEADADRDLAHGAPAAAARALLWSSSLSSDGGTADRRHLAAVGALIASRQDQRAAGLRDRTEACRPSPQRDLLLGLIDWFLGRADDAVLWLEAVVAPSAGADPASAARAWAELAEIHVVHERPEDALDAADRALALAEPGTPAEHIAWVHLAVADAQLHGSPAGLERLRQRLPGPAAAVSAGEADLLVARATLALYGGSTTAALEDLRVAAALSLRGIGPVQIARTHFETALSLVTTGDWDTALVHARTGLGIATDGDQPAMQAQCHAVRAMVASARGRWVEAADALTAADAAVASHGSMESAALLTIAAAAGHDARHEPKSVIDLLTPLAAAPPVIGRLAFWPPLVTALLADGELERADEQIEAFARAVATRGLSYEPRITGLRAQLAAASGAPGTALPLFALACESYGPDDPYLERALLTHAHARALLATGEHDEASRRLHEARDALAAVAAEPYLERVDADLGATAAAERRPSRSPLDLTDRERDVAVLVARGLTNPEVAAELYVSRKAVEYHLGNIFGKLGITSRRQLRGRTF